MTEITHPPEQRYVCTAKECTNDFTSIDDWRKHVEGYRFEKGHICLYDHGEGICNTFIPIASDQMLSHQAHLHLKHNVKGQNATRDETKKNAKLFIEKNLYSVNQGEIYCFTCRKKLQFSNREKALEHIQEHVLDGCQIKIPGQTKSRYERNAEAGTSERPADEDEGEVVDLSQRGTIVCISP